MNRRTLLTRIATSFVVAPIAALLPRQRLATGGVVKVAVKHYPVVTGDCALIRPSDWNTVHEGVHITIRGVADPESLARLAEIRERLAAMRVGTWQS